MVLAQIVTAKVPVHQTGTQLLSRVSWEGKTERAFGGSVYGSES